MSDDPLMDKLPKWSVKELNEFMVKRDNDFSIDDNMCYLTESDFSMVAIRLQIKKDDGEKLSEKHERILHWMSYFEKKQEAAVDAMMKSGDETMAKADKSMKEGDEFMAQVKKEMNEEEGDFNEWLDAVDSSDAILEKMMNCDDEEKLAVLKTKMESLIAKMDAATVGDDDGDN